MNLHYYESTIFYSTLISWLVPVVLGFFRGLHEKSGWITLLASLSGLIFWSGIMIQICMEIWNDQYLKSLEKEALNGLGSNGAANAFASIFGWIPGVILFFVSLFCTYLFFRWISSKLQKTNQT